MLIPHPFDNRHKTHLINLLQAVLSDNTLSNHLLFKGGTCAALRGILPRFSIDLDFDLATKDENIQKDLKRRLHKIFRNQKLTLAQESVHHLQFFLKYNAPPKQRNTLKLEINDDLSRYNDYESITLSELNLVCHAQTISTMVANKLVATLNRLEKNGHPAGRDFFDLREFFLAGLPVKREIVEERSGISYSEYLTKLLYFIQNNLTSQALYQDLNTLLPSHNFKHAVDQIIPDLTLLLTDELSRSQQSHTA